MSPCLGVGPHVVTTIMTSVWTASGLPLIATLYAADSGSHNCATIVVYHRFSPGIDFGHKRG